MVVNLLAPKKNIWKSNSKPQPVVSKVSLMKRNISDCKMVIEIILLKWAPFIKLAKNRTLFFFFSGTEANFT